VSTSSTSSTSTGPNSTERLVPIETHAKWRAGPSTLSYIRDTAAHARSPSVHRSTHTMPCVDSLTFANNKGGSGKTFLGFQFACEAARANPAFKVLVVDLSLYSETSGLLMGGLKREHALAPTAGRMRTVRFAIIYHPWLFRLLPASAVAAERSTARISGTRHHHARRIRPSHLGAG
jgi:hypothetical protein